MDIEKLYRKRFLQDSIGERARHVIWRILCHGFFDKYIPQNAVLLEIGAGYCEFINNVSEKCSEKIALDINPDCRQFASPNVRVLNEDCQNIKSMPDDSADVIFMSNFLEHLSSREAILNLFNECHRILKNRGSLLILNPNIRLVGGAYWDFFDHVLPLTEKSLAEALEITGFKINECIPAFLPYTTKSALPSHPALVWLYLKMPFIWRLLGKQCFISASPEHAKSIGTE